MSIYSSDHPGVILDEITLSNLGIQDSDQRGYFSNNAIIDLLDNNPNCAGIRIYNINPNNEFSALLAVCVSDNGADMQKDGTHVMCFPIDKPSNNVDVLTRDRAFELIKKGYSFDVNQSEKFSSFFSKSMLRSLIDENGNEDGPSGLAFYKVIWLGGRSTHLAVTSKFDIQREGMPIIGLNEKDFKHCLSDQPCPGHCANMDANGDDIISNQPMKSKPVTTPEEIEVAVESHYIPIWE